ncbi:MAG: glycerophosphodiester phosphodiesterase [Muribaculaceae bacterium]|nr:glycerophosphodiester phosphodiesterase [Muribaculaceae bacterium]
MKNILFIVMILPLLMSGCASNGNVGKEVNSVVQYNGVPVDSGVIQIYSHRAARGLMPEQTMPAYKGALQIGADYMDMDIGITKDGVIVITHDLGLNPNLTRDSAGDWVNEARPINSMTLKEVQSYNVGMLKPETEYASYFPHQRSVDTCIPTLSEAVDYIKTVAGDKVGFQIEIKNDPTKPELTATPKEFADALYKLLLEKDIINRTEVQSFDWQCLIELEKLDGNVKTAFLTDHTTEVMNDSEPGTWIAGLKPKDFNYSLPQMVAHLKGDCWEPFEGDLTKADLEEAQKLGLKVVVWGWPEVEGSEFDYEMVNKMIEWGVDGIITDRPDILRGLLSARGYKISQGFNVGD